MILQGEHKASIKLLLELLHAEIPLNPINLYIVLCELENCYREIEDFKEAYRYANEKIALLEQLLKEI